MAATSTNKQPLLVDRPFLRGARITAATPTVDNEFEPSLGRLIQLVRVGDIPSEDSALVESVTFVSNEDYPDPSGFYPGSGEYGSGEWYFTDPQTDNLHQAQVGIYIYAPDQANPATATPLLVSNVAINFNEYFKGEGQRIDLLEALTPVPQTTALLAGRNTIPPNSPITEGKTSSLNLEKGYILCVGLINPNFQIDASGNAIPGLTMSGMQVFAQGGFY